MKEYPHPRIGIVCQTTTLPGVAQEIVDQIRAKNADKLVRVENTICQPTLERQDALARLLPQVDALVVVGGRNSNNTKKLAEIAIENGVPAFHVESAQDLELSRLEEFEVVGLTAGTSTTDAAVEEVYEALLAASSDSSSPAPA